MLSRRRFLQASALTFGAAGLTPFSALAADRTGYKALVCVFLFGGCDTHDMLIGHDQPSYDGWAGARPSILQNFQDVGNPTARDRANLLALQPSNANQFGSRSFAMPPEMAPLKNLFDAGSLAIVPNVGPLIEPTTRQAVQDGTARLPARIQSHNDQQSTWQTFGTEGRNTGWGGLMMDAMAETSPYAAISASGQSVFLTGQDTTHLTLSRSKNIREAWGTGDSVYGSSELADRIRAWYGQSGQGATNPMMRDMIRAQGQAVADTAYLAEVLESQSIGDTIRIDNNRLSSQLATIGDMIGARSALGVNRQVFFASMGGFDTHNNHANSMPTLLSQLSEAIASFQAGIEAAGLAQDVTLFTASDFGRTLTSNSSGTDHGWGAHHMVVGGAVRGGMIHGNVPEFTLGHPQDYRRGAMIPEIAVEQYGSELGRWFGLNETELDAIFTNRGNFDRFGLQLFA